MRSRKAKILVVLGFVAAAAIIIVAAVVIPLSTSGDDAPSNAAPGRVKSGQTEFIPVSPAPLGTVAGVFSTVNPTTGQIIQSCDRAAGAENTVKLNGVMTTPNGIRISSHGDAKSVRITIHGDNGTRAVIVNDTMAGAVPQKYAGDFMALYLSTGEYGPIESVRLCGGGY